MKTDEFKKAVAQAKIEINDKLEEFLQRVDKASDDPDNFITMTELEREWRELKLSTSKTYSDLVSKMLSSMDTKELNKSKKVISSGKAST